MIMKGNSLEKGNNRKNQPLNRIITQCLDVISNDGILDQLKDNLIEPLVEYFKKRLRFFYVVITILLILILITNVISIYLSLNNLRIVATNTINPS